MAILRVSNRNVGKAILSFFGYIVQSAFIGQIDPDAAAKVSRPRILYGQGAAPVLHNLWTSVLTALVLRRLFLGETLNGAKCSLRQSFAGGLL